MNTGPSLDMEATPPSNCAGFSPLLGVLLDGELQAEKTAMLEEHLAVCETCRERMNLMRAMRGSLKDAVRKNVMSDAMRERMANAMTAERARRQAREATTVRSWRRYAVQGTVVLSAAAALAFTWRAQVHGGMLTGIRASPSVLATSRGSLADLMNEHSHPLPPERTNLAEVRALERYVGVPVNPPKQLEREGAHLVGGRVLNMQQERAAMLQYEVGQGPSAQRMSVFIYDPRKIQVTGPSLASRAVGSSEVQVGRADGYSVVVTERGGVGYVVATDMDPEASVRLVAAGNE